MKSVSSLIALVAAVPAAGQLSPDPGADDPRIQSVAPAAGVTVRLVTFPDAPLTVAFRPGERIERVLVSDGAAFDVAVVGRQDSITVSPRRADARASLSVTTASNVYRFEVETGTGLMAANLVSVLDPGRIAPTVSSGANKERATEITGTYRLRGDRELRPVQVEDDGEKTYLRWGEHQALPAVFGVGPTGNEEVVNGYMRGDLFTIDRVYRELVFRIDKAKAEASREQGMPGS